MFGVTEFPPWRSKSTQMDLPWLDTGSYSVRMKHNASRRLSRYLQDPPDTTKNRKIQKITKTPEIQTKSSNRPKKKSLSGRGSAAAPTAQQLDPPETAAAPTARHAPT